MIFAGNAKQAEEYWEQGFDMVAIGTDSGFLIDRGRSVMSELIKNLGRELR